MIRVLIVSDLRLYGEGLSEILERESFITIIGLSQTVDLALNIVATSSPDVVLVDMSMLRWKSAIDQIIASCPEVKLVALALTEDEDIIMNCAIAGVSGYLSREASIDELIKTLKGVVNGEICCPKRLAASLFHKLKSSSHETDLFFSPKNLQSDNSKIELLTNREKEIAEHFKNGLSNKQIARKLSIELSTVKNHVHNILVKMGVENRLQAANLLTQHYSQHSIDPKI